MRVLSLATWRRRTPRGRPLAALTALAACAAGGLSFIATAREHVCAPGGRGAAVSCKAAKKAVKVVTMDSDEFNAAREKIRRIQLGLGPNDPLPPEDEEGDATPTLVPKSGGELELAEAKDTEMPTVNVTADANITDALGDPEAIADAFAGRAKDVEELKPLPKKAKDGPNFFQSLFGDLFKVTVPPPLEVAQTFGIVILLSALYTGFVAVVDLGSQSVLGQVFSEFYQAAKPEDA